MYFIDTRKYDDSFLLAKILEKVDFTDEETKKLFKHFEIPAIDAVEVVRCKDCRFRYKDGANFCLLGTQSDEWFCANGERNDEID